MDWELKKELKEQLQEEQGYYIYPVGTRTRFALVYPNSYFVGMSNLGFHIIYDLLNKRQDTACERVFLPERTKIQRYINTRTPIMSIETQSPLYDFDVLGFAVSFEMDYFNVLQLLEMGKVKLKALERGERDPIVIAGGPCPTFNPEPLSAIFDAFIIGEGEVIMPAFMDAYHAAKREGVPRQEMLRRLAEVPGVYVPSLYEHHYDDKGHLTSIKPLEGAPEKSHASGSRTLTRIRRIPSSSRTTRSLTSTSSRRRAAAAATAVSAWQATVSANRATARSPSSTKRCRKPLSTASASASWAQPSRIIPKSTSSARIS